VVTVTTERCTLQLDAITGDLRGVHWNAPALEVIRDHRLGENFRILLPSPNREANYFNSRDQAVSRIERDAQGATCIYDSLRNEFEAVDVSARYRMEVRGDSLEMSIKVENRTDRPVAEVYFGLLGGLQGVGNRADTRSLVPGPHSNLAPDIFHTFPAGEYGGGNLGIRYSAGGFWYPGSRGMSMSWCEFYNARSDIGLYYGLHHSETRLSVLYLELRPFTISAVSGTNWPSQRDIPDDEPLGLTVGWVNFPYTRNSTVDLGPVVIQVHRGDWRAGSGIYRRWFDTQFTMRSRGWLRAQMAWQSTILLNPEDAVVHCFNDLPKMAADAKKYDVTTFEICGWDIGGIDRGYPDYRPDPRLGTRQEFQAALAEMSSLGVRPVVFANLQVADTATEQFRDRLHRFVVHGKWAEDLILRGFGEGTISARLGLTQSNMAVLSLSHPELRQMLVDQMIDLVRDGADALQLDKVTVVQYLDFNAASPASPDQSAPNGVLMALEEILERGRQVNPEFALASETWWDRAFQFVDILYSRMVDIDIPSTALLYTFPEVASTIFAENPGDFNVMNNGMRYGMVWAFAPRHYMDSMDEPLTRPLSAYVKELIRIRSKHRDLLFEGRFQDGEGATVSRHRDVRYSVFRSALPEIRRRACVVVNYGDRPRETSVGLSGGSPRVEVLQPYHEDRVATSPVLIQLSPRACAVVVELPNQ
jgi:hypothetical protein